MTKGTFKGNETPYIPRIRANANLEYQITKSANASVAYKYFGKTRSGNDDNYTLVKSKSYQVSDVKLSYKVKNFKRKYINYN